VIPLFRMDWDGGKLLQESNGKGAAPAASGVSRSAARARRPGIFVENMTTPTWKECDNQAARSGR
jgi:hypothetical protein